MPKKIFLISGSAGFIGFHLSSKILSKGYKVIGIDNLNNYYDVILKNDRVNRLNKKALEHKSKFYFVKGDLSEKNDLKKIFKNEFYKTFKNKILGHFFNLKVPQIFAPKAVGVFKVP